MGKGIKIPKHRHRYEWSSGNIGAVCTYTWRLNLVPGSQRRGECGHRLSAETVLKRFNAVQVEPE